MLFRKYRTNSFVIIIAAVILGVCGYVNGFPILYSDTGTYIVTGFENIVPDDRTIFYGLFLRHISLMYSLFFVTFIQSIFLSYLLFLLLKQMVYSSRFNLLFLIIISFLVLFTGISFHASRLIPDIFSGILFISFLILVFDKSLDKNQLRIVSILFLFSSMTHLSNLFISILLLIILFVADYRHFLHLDLAYKRKKRLTVLLFSSIILIPTCHFLIGGKFQYSRGSHVFLMERLIESGTLKKYLSDNCDKNTYKICDYQDEIDPYTFIWGYDESPLYKTGGWEDNRKDFRSIIYDVLTDWKYLKIHIPFIIENTFKQLFYFDVEVRSNENKSGAGLAIERYYSKLQGDMNGSKQALGKLDFKRLNIVQKITVYLCLSLLLLMSITKAKTEGESKIKTLVIILLLFLALNAFVCGAISGVHMRYQSRIIWTIPLVLIMAIPTYLKRFTHKSNLD